MPGNLLVNSELDSQYKKRAQRTYRNWGIRCDAQIYVDDVNL